MTQTANMRYQVTDSRTQNGEARRPPLATPAEISDFLGVPMSTLTQWRYRGVGPRWCKIGRHVRYRWDDVEAFVAAQVRESAT